MSLDKPKGAEGRESRHVRVSGLPPAASEERIAAHFAMFGRVHRVSRVEGSSSSSSSGAGDAIVSFMDVRSAQKAARSSAPSERASKHKFDGHWLQVSFHEPGAAPAAAATSSAAESAAAAAEQSPGKPSSSAEGSPTKALSLQQRLSQIRNTPGNPFGGKAQRAEGQAEDASEGGKPVAAAATTAGSVSLSLVRGHQVANLPNPLPASPTPVASTSAQHLNVCDPLHRNASRTLHVGGLERGASDESVRSRFAHYGHILAVHIKSRDHSASVEFTNINAVAAVINATRADAPSSSHEAEAKPAEVHWGKSVGSNKLWLGALPKSCSDAYLVSKMRVISPDAVDETIYDAKFHEALVIFKTPQAALNAYERLKSKAITFPPEKPHQESAGYVQVDYSSERLHNYFIDRAFGRFPSSPSTRRGPAEGAPPADAAGLLAPPPDPPKSLPLPAFSGGGGAPTADPSEQASAIPPDPAMNSSHGKPQGDGDAPEAREPAAAAEDRRSSHSGSVRQEAPRRGGDAQGGRGAQQKRRGRASSGSSSSSASSSTSSSSNARESASAVRRGRERKRPSPARREWRERPRSSNAPRRAPHYSSTERRDFHPAAASGRERERQGRFGSGGRERERERERSRHATPTAGGSGSGSGRQFGRGDDRRSWQRSPSRTASTTTTGGGGASRPHTGGGGGAPSSSSSSHRQPRGHERRRPREERSSSSASSSSSSSSASSSSSTASSRAEKRKPPAQQKDAKVPAAEAAPRGKSPQERGRPTAPEPTALPTSAPPLGEAHQQQHGSGAFFTPSQQQQQQPKSAPPTSCSVSRPTAGRQLLKTAVGIPCSAAVELGDPRSGRRPPPAPDGFPLPRFAHAHGSGAATAERRASSHSLGGSLNSSGISGDASTPLSAHHQHHAGFFASSSTDTHSTAARGVGELTGADLRNRTLSIDSVGSLNSPFASSADILAGAKVPCATAKAPSGFAQRLSALGSQLNRTQENMHERTRIFKFGSAGGLTRKPESIEEQLERLQAKSATAEPAGSTSACPFLGAAPSRQLSSGAPLDAHEPPADASLPPPPQPQMSSPSGTLKPALKPFAPPAKSDASVAQPAAARPRSDTGSAAQPRPSASGERPGTGSLTPSSSSSQPPAHPLRKLQLTMPSEHTAASAGVSASPHSAAAASAQKHARVGGGNPGPAAALPTPTGAKPSAPSAFPSAQPEAKKLARPKLSTPTSAHRDGKQPMVDFFTEQANDSVRFCTTPKVKKSVPTATPVAAAVKGAPSAKVHTAAAAHPKPKGEGEHKPKQPARGASEPRHAPMRPKDTAGDHERERERERRKAAARLERRTKEAQHRGDADRRHRRDGDEAMERKLKKRKRKRRDRGEPSTDSEGGAPPFEDFGLEGVDLEEQKRIYHEIAFGMSMYDRVKRRSSAPKQADEKKKARALQKIREQSSGKKAKGSAFRRIQLSDSSADHSDASGRAKGEGAVEYSSGAETASSLQRQQQQQRAGKARESTVDSPERASSSDAARGLKAQPPQSRPAAKRSSGYSA